MTHFLFNLFKLVDLFNSSFSNKIILHGNFTQLLKLTTSHIIDACLFEKPSSILYLDLSYNLVSNIEMCCFTYTKLIYTMILKSNKIFHLFMDSFSNLFNLRFLDLSDNPITFIPNYSFRNLPHLTLFNITLTLNTRIDAIIFENIKINPIVIKLLYCLCIPSQCNMFTLSSLVCFLPWHFT